MIGQFFDNIIVASTDKECNNDPSNVTSWKILETVLSHLKTCIGGFHVTQVSLIITQVKNKIAYHSIN